MKYEMRPQYIFHLDKDETRFLLEQLKFWNVYGKCPMVEINDKNNTMKYYFAFEDDSDKTDSINKGGDKNGKDNSR